MKTERIKLQFELIPNFIYLPGFYFPVERSVLLMLIIMETKGIYLILFKELKCYLRSGIDMWKGKS